MLYVMKPLDNFFFRTSVPFEAGGETVAVESMFPPLPSVYAGAFCRYLGLGADRIKIGFNGICLGDRAVFPVPADLYWLSNGEKPGGGVLGCKVLSESPVSSYPLDYCLHRPDTAVKDKEQRNPYLTEETMGEYLNASGQEYPCIDLQHGYLVREPKIGIAVDDMSGTSKRHLLYQTAAVRPVRDKSVGLMADVKIRAARQGKAGSDIGETREGITQEGFMHGLPVKNVIHLGGEGRLASVTYMGNDNGLPTVTNKDGRLGAVMEEANSRYFKIYLATPAIFEKGWLPGWLDEGSMEGSFTYKKRSVRIRLVAACVGRSVPCGGFGRDKKAGRCQPKELRYAVPAGSVYYFKLIRGSFADALKLFTGKCISDYRESFGFSHPLYDRYRYCDRGYGYALAGRLSKEQEDNLNER